MIGYYLLICMTATAVISWNIRRKRRQESQYTGKSYIPQVDYETEEKREFYAQQLRDYKKMYTLTQKELNTADTLKQQKTALNKLITLDAKIFNLQQKLYKLEEE